MSITWLRHMLPKRKERICPYENRMFRTVWFIIAKSWKQLWEPFVGEWVNQLWHIHRMQSNSDIKSNAMPHSVMGMNLRSMLSERKQSQISKVTEVQCIGSCLRVEPRARSEAEIKRHMQETLGVMVMSIILTVGIAHGGCQNSPHSALKHCTA